MGLFGTKKPNITFINRKNEYYRNYYFPKQLCDGIDMVSAVELISKKAAAEMLMKAGLSSYMGEKVTEHIQSEEVARKLNQKAARFVLFLFSGNMPGTMAWTSQNIFKYLTF